jgi:hypothetical protein
VFQEMLGLAVCWDMFDMFGNFSYVRDSFSRIEIDIAGNSMSASGQSHLLKSNVEDMD